MLTQCCVGKLIHLPYMVITIIREEIENLLCLLDISHQIHASEDTQDRYFKNMFSTFSQEMANAFPWN